jgi:branched-chain amino acid transport system permease protein
VLIVGLLFARRTMSRAEVASTGSWSIAEEQRPVPVELASLAPVRYTRWGFIGVATLALALLPFLSPVRITSLAGVILIHGIVALSLVVLTGWGGQVSLAQFAFVAIGSVLGGALTNRVGIPFWFALPITAAVVAAVAFLVGLPALRVRGLFLLAVSFAFAVAVRSALFDERLFGWLLPERVDRPTLFFVSFDDERAMYFLCLVALAASTAFVLNVRRSRLGRLLIALRDNELDTQAQGIDTARLKLMAFALSGALAGFAGCLLAHHQRGFSPDSFGAQAGIDLFLYSILGGIGSPAGALLGTTIQGLTTYLVTSRLWQSVLGPGAALYILYAAPGGVVSVLNRVRDGALRILAQRRQLVVPALYAGADRRALAAQLIPLAPASTRGGLAEVPGARSMILESLAVPSAASVDEGEEARREERSVLVTAAASAEPTSATTDGSES